MPRSDPTPERVMGGLDLLQEAMTVTLAPAGDLTRHLHRAVDAGPRSGSARASDCPEAPKKM